MNEYRFEYLTLQELQAELLNKSKGQILIKTTYRGKSIVIPPEMAGMIGDPTGIMKKAQLKSELLLEPFLLPIAGTTGVHSVPFNTKGYRWILVLITNPVWTTNPTDLLATYSFTLDDATFYDLLNPNGTLQTNVCRTLDGVTSCHFVSGDQFVNDIGPFPSNTANMKFRITMTPVGTAESKNIEISAYGIG